MFVYVCECVCAFKMTRDSQRQNEREYRWQYGMAEWRPEECYVYMHGVGTKPIGYGRDALPITTSELSNTTTTSSKHKIERNKWRNVKIYIHT